MRNQTQSLDITTYTAPHDSGSPASINDADDIRASTHAVWDDLRARDTLRDYDGVLVACYSAHPLVGKIATDYPNIAVTGIFEASIVAALPLLRRTPGGGGGWGIVTTGRFWEDHLTHAVEAFLGQRKGDDNAWFQGVFTTGLNASDFHGGVSPETLRDRLTGATRRLLKKSNVNCVIMGCAGMAGLEEIIRSAVGDEYGGKSVADVYVIDGVRAGVGVLEQMIRSRRMFLPH